MKTQTLWLGLSHKVKNQVVARPTGKGIGLNRCIAIERCHWAHDMEKQWLLIKLKKQLLAQE